MNILTDDAVSVIREFYPDQEPVRKIASGAYGNVYECVKNDPATNFETRSAIKVVEIPREDMDITSFAADMGQTAEEYCERLKEEALTEIRKMYELNSAYTVTIHDYYLKKKEGLGFYILFRMDLLRSLEEVQKEWFFKDKAYVTKTVKKLCSQICNALMVCQNKETIHRDIKPNNIMITANEEFQLADFGLATTLEKGSSLSVAGTNNYMAPEVISGAYDYRADLFSLGRVLYKIANHGRDPYLPSLAEKEKLTRRDLVEANRRFNAGEELPLPDNCSEEMGQIIVKMNAYRAEDRFNSAEEIVNLLSGQSERDKNSKKVKNPLKQNSKNPPVRKVAVEKEENSRQKPAGYSKEKDNVIKVSENPGYYKAGQDTDYEKTGQTPAPESEESQLVPASETKQVPQGKKTKEKKPKSKKPLYILAAVLVAILTFVGYSLYYPIWYGIKGPRKVDLNSYIKFELDAATVHDGDGSAHFSFDTELLAQEIVDYYKIYKKTQILADGFTPEELNTVAQAQDWINDYIGIDLPPDVYSDGYHDGLADFSNLTNGQTLTVTLDYYKGINKSNSGDIIGIEFTGENPTLTIPADAFLPKETIDPFEYLTVDYDGYAPYGKISFSVKGNHELTVADFSLKNPGKQNHLSSGEKFEVLFDGAIRLSNNEREFAPTEKTYTCKELPRYVMEKLSESDLQDLRAKADTALNNYMNQDLPDMHLASHSDLTYKGYYLLPAASENGQSDLYLIYDTVISSNEPENSNESMNYQTKPLYLAYTFKNLTYDTNGVLHYTDSEQYDSNGFYYFYSSSRFKGFNSLTNVSETIKALNSLVIADGDVY